MSGAAANAKQYGLQYGGDGVSKWLQIVMAKLAG